MANSKFTLEMHMRVYDDKNGEFVEVREDRDGLGLVEIVQGDKIITMPVEQARLLIDGVEKVCAHIQQRKVDEVKE